MAEDTFKQDEEAKTEEPTHKKLEDAFKKGNVFSSKETNSFFVFLFFTIYLGTFLPRHFKHILQDLKIFIQNFNDFLLLDSLNLAYILYIMSNIATQFLILFSTLILIIIVSFFLQRGRFIFTSEQLKFDLKRISLLSGFKKMFSLRNFVELIKTICKLLIFTGYIYIFNLIELDKLILYQNLSTTGLLSEIYKIILHIFIFTSIFSLVIGVIDFAFQRYDYMKNLKMSRKDIKDEMKEMEGNPEIKQRIKSLGYALIKRNLKKIIPDTTVIISNPTHYAVALKYEHKEMSAPVCKAKGVDLIAKYIKQLAKEHDIVIVENPTLARALYKDTKIDFYIPNKYFKEVAKVISYVLNLNRKKSAIK